VAQLRGVVPALEESEITRERLALEEAIRKIEAESVRRAREEARNPPSRRPESPPQQREEPPPAAPSPPPRPQPLTEPLPPRERGQAAQRSLSDEALKGFRDVVSDVGASAPPPARAERPNYSPPPAPTYSPPPAPSYAPPPASTPHQLKDLDQAPRQLEPDNLWALPLDSAPPAPATEAGETRAPLPTRPRPPRPAPIEDSLEPRPRARSARSLVGSRQIVIALLLVLVGVLAAVGWWQRGAIGDAVGGLFAFVRSPSAPSAPPGTTTTQTRPKIPDRIGQPGQTGAPPVAQRVVLYEEVPDDPEGKRLLGSVVWTNEMIAPAPGRTPEIAVRATVEVPERRMTMTWSLRRNSDQSLPASHTIEILFTLPPDSPSSGVQNVPGVLMKQAEQTRGVPLAGLAVKVTPGFFLIGLSSLESDMLRNVQLLKERSWFDIPIVYNNNRRAILAMEKGTPGERAFNDAFAAWRQ
jgi:hypothetical protein